MRTSNASWHYLALLILAGEAIFILPFVLPRVFRPTVLEAYAIDNTQLGFCYSTYGIIALLSYLFGGVLADKYAPGKLIAVALWMTAAGGFYFATFPHYSFLKLLYGYWGFTTIFLFWAAMIKAARVWGGKAAQGKAFGFLDGGRGLVGALIGSMGVFIFSLIISDNLTNTNVVESQTAFKYVILSSCAIIVLIGILVWFFLRMEDQKEAKIVLNSISKKDIKEVLKLPAVWLLMVIILCAYVGYKITDVFSLYAKEIMLYDQVASAKVGTFLLYIRPVIGIVIGIVADRTRTTFWLFTSFVVTLIGALLFATGVIATSSTLIFLLSTLIVATGVYAARSLYFSVMERGMIPITLTGTAVGLISLVGYTPDIFAGPTMGYLLDSTPGITGHQNVFWMLSIFSSIGVVASWIYFRLYRKNKNGCL